MVLVGNTQLVEHKLCIALCVPAVHIGKFRFQLPGAHAIRLAKVRFGVQGVLFFHNFNETGVAHQHGAHHLVLVVGKVVLLEHAEPLAGGDDHLSLLGLQLAVQHF